MRAIARRLDVNFKTVRRYVRAASVDALLAGGVQVSVLDPFKPYLNDRLADGERNATRLLAEITGQGYTGGYNTLNRYLRPLRRLDAATARGAAAATGAAGGTEGHRLDHRPAEQSRTGQCGTPTGDPRPLPRAGRRRPARRRIRPDDQGPVR